MGSLATAVVFDDLIGQCFKPRNVLKLFGMAIGTDIESIIKPSTIYVIPRIKYFLICLHCDYVVEEVIEL